MLRSRSCRDLAAPPNPTRPPLAAAARLLPLALTGALLLAARTPADDLIIRTGGKSTRVFRVTKAKYSGVSFILKQGLREQTIARQAVKRIRFGDTPAAFTTGQELLRKGDYANAIKAFKEARTDPNVRTWWVSVWCPLHTAQAYLRWAVQTRDKAKASEASDIVAGVKKEYPDNFFKPEFEVLGIRALMAAGEPAKAAASAEALEKEASSWKEKTWYMQAKLLGARALAAAKRYPDAISKLDTLVTFARTSHFKDWEAEALTLKASTLLEEGNKDRALHEFENLTRQIDSSWSNRAAAAAYIGLGRVLLEDFGKPHEARESLLTARVLYFGSDRADLEGMAEAAYWLGRVGEALARHSPPEPGAKLEAARYYEEIIKQYGTTSWADRAREGRKHVKG